MPSRMSRSCVNFLRPFRRSGGRTKYAEMRVKKPKKNDWFIVSITARTNGVPGAFDGSMKYQPPGPPQVIEQCDTMTRLITRIRSLSISRSRGRRFVPVLPSSAMVKKTDGHVIYS
ncbi:MAG: hypothetical protein A4E35_00738 [Methanoregula sp. PtaU1.Bin051]|nr:MAG: hypothetical protein A4E35_00738 [Methanoregula sp. PtaU1.Bin051]